jgi:hypothetical protein
VTLVDWIDKWQPKYRVTGKELRPNGHYRYTYQLSVRGREEVLEGEFNETDDLPFNLNNLLISFAWDLAIFYDGMPMAEFARDLRMSMKDKDVSARYRGMMQSLESIKKALGPLATNDLSEVRE